MNLLVNSIWYRPQKLSNNSNNNLLTYNLMEECLFNSNKNKLWLHSNNCSNNNNNSYNSSSNNNSNKYYYNNSLQEDIQAVQVIMEAKI